MVKDLTNAVVDAAPSRDSVVIIDNFQSVRGGATLDTTGFLPPVIEAGHIIIQETATKNYKPMPVTSNGALVDLGALSAGSGYTNDGTYTDVAFTGGSGSGAKGTIVVSGNKVVSATITTPGTGYKQGDSLSAAAANIGTSGSGFAVVVAAVDNTPAAYGSLPSGHTYAGVNIATIKTDKPFAGIMLRGTVNVNASAVPLSSILSAVKSALPLIIFTSDKA